MIVPNSDELSTMLFEKVTICFQIKYQKDNKHRGEATILESYKELTLYGKSLITKAV